MKSKDKLRSQYDEITCRIDKKSLFPVSMAMKMKNVVVEVQFLDIISYTAGEMAKPAIDDAKFNFKAPEGTEEIEGDSLLQGMGNSQNEKKPADSGKEK